jgi:elongation factor G
MAAKDEAPDLSKFRNMGVIAHIDAGKTTTTEHLLYYAGAKHKLGGVDEGTTDTDYDPEEQERGITIYSACVPFQWQDCTINLIDTPGHVDFTAEVERSLRVLDGAVVVFDAQKGVEAQSETVWRQANKYHVPRLVFVNKMDVVGANFANVVDEVKERLEGRPVAVTIPIGSGSIKDSPTPFAGIIDLIEMKALYYEAPDGKKFRVEEIPEELRDEARRYRERLFDVLTEHDEQDRLTTTLLEGGQPPAENVRAALREQTLKEYIHPVLCGSGREHIGIQPLLDAICWYLPCPLDRPPVTGTNPKKKDKEEKRSPDPKEPLAALVFKIVAGSHGDLFYVRVYSGILKANSRPYNATRDVKEFASKLYHTHADPRDRTEVPAGYAGDIVAVIGMKEAVTGDTICDINHPILLEPITFAQGVVSKSIEPQSSADKQKLLDTLAILKREDPTFEWKLDPETGQTLMTGMGVLHLEVKQHRMERDFRLKVRVGQPLVSYRETIRQAKTVVGEFVRQAGTSGGLFAKVKVAVEPFKGTQPITIETRLPENLDIPPLFLAAAEQGLRGALSSGELGYPVMNVKATLLGAELDPQTSNEIAFQAAAADAVHRAMRDNIVLLEPIMKLDVTVPEEYLGPIQADLQARRAKIENVHHRGKLRVVEAFVPLARVFDYSEKVRSLSQGRADPVMEPHDFAAAPDEVLRQKLHPEEFF